jgi:hypothetical protein
MDIGQLLVVREYFDSGRSDVSEVRLVQANGEVNRPANGARNKVMTCHVGVRMCTPRANKQWNSRNTRGTRWGGGAANAGWNAAGCGE